MRASVWLVALTAICLCACPKKKHEPVQPMSDLPALPESAEADAGESPALKPGGALCGEEQDLSQGSEAQAVCGGRCRQKCRDCTKKCSDTQCQDFCAGKRRECYVFCLRTWPR